MKNTMKLKSRSMHQILISFERRLENHEHSVDLRLYLQIQGDYRQDVHTQKFQADVPPCPFPGSTFDDSDKSWPIKVEKSYCEPILQLYNILENRSVGNGWKAMSR